MITKHEELIKLKKEFVHAREITSCISIDIQLPIQISKLILSKEILDSIYFSNIINESFNN